MSLHASPLLTPREQFEQALSEAAQVQEQIRACTCELKARRWLDEVVCEVELQEAADATH